MYALFETNGVFQYTGRNLGVCKKEGCHCDVYCAPSPIGGLCTNCKHSPAVHARLCDQCEKSIIDESTAYRLTCLDMLCKECESKYSLKNFLYPFF